MSSDPYNPPQCIKKKEHIRFCLCSVNGKDDPVGQLLQDCKWQNRGNKGI